MGLDQWRKKGLREEDGVVVAADVGIEWLLPWWWDHYRQKNGFPLFFVDFGMSQSMQKWCQARGEYFRLPVADVFVREKEALDPKLVSKWEVVYGHHFFDFRPAFFKKPLACLQSPFRRSIWMDLDCEVKDSIEPLFSFADSPLGVSAALERNGSIFNGGVLVFRRGASLIQEWAKQSISSNHLFATDQDLLSHLIRQREEKIEEIPLIYNWSRTREVNQDAKVIHWHGVLGKKEIYKRLNERAVF